MKILIVAALAKELNLIKSGIKSAWLKTNLNIDYLCCWVWNYESIFSLEQYLTKNPEPIFVWNIGICGYWNSENKKLNEPIQAASIINIHTEKERIVPPFLKLAPLKNCFSSETIIFNKPNFEKEFLTIDDEMYFDMESRWISFVAERYKMPYLILKVPFDFVWNETDWLFDDKWSIIKEKKSDCNCLENLSYKAYLEHILDRINKQEKAE